MPATLGRLPVRVQVGDGDPVEIGTWEVDLNEPLPGRAEFADMLRAAADEIAPRPRTVVNVEPDPPHIAAQIRDLRRRG